MAIKKWLNYPVQSFQIVGANYKFDFNLALTMIWQKWL
jgi:hypothetical protein